MSTKLIKHTFKDPIYYMETTVLIGSVKKVNEYLRKKYDSKIKDIDHYDARYFCVDHKGIRLNFIQIDEFNWSIDEQAMLAHEILHLVNNNMAYVGIPLTEDTDEAYAYYYTFVFRKIWNLLKPKK